MFIAFLVDAVATAQRLDLNLVCEGQYADTERSVGTSGGMVNGEYRTRTAVVTTPVMKPGTAHLTLSGDGGRLTYPDGRERILGNVVADASQISADYQKKQLVWTSTWKVEVNRMTGAIRVKNGSDISFAGTCTPQSTQPKF